MIVISDAIHCVLNVYFTKSRELSISSISAIYDVLKKLQVTNKNPHFKLLAELKNSYKLVTSIFLQSKSFMKLEILGSSAMIVGVVGVSSVSDEVS